MSHLRTERTDRRRTGVRRPVRLVAVAAAAATFAAGGTGAGAAQTPAERCAKITSDQTWEGTKVLDCETTIGAGVTVTVAPGATVQLPAKAALDVAGTLVSVTGGDRPAIFVGSGRTQSKIRVEGGGTVWMHGARVETAPIDVGTGTLVLSGSALSASPVSVSGARRAVVEANTFTGDTPVSFVRTGAPVVGGNTFAPGSTLTTQGADDLSGVGANTLQDPQARIEISDSDAGANFVVNPGRWTVDHLHVKTGEQMTVNAGADVMFAGTTTLDGALQTSRGATDPPVTFTGNTKTTIDVKETGLLFVNGGALAGLRTEGTGRQVIVNTTVNDTSIATTGAAYGPLLEADHMTASTVATRGGTPVIGGNTFAATTVTVTGAYDLSGLGSNTFDAPQADTSGTGIVVSGGTVVGTWNVPAGNWTVDGTQVAAGGVLTLLPGATAAVGPDGLTVDGILQVVGEPGAAAALKGAPGRRQPELRVGAGGIAFSWRGAVANLVVTNKVSNRRTDGYVAVIESSVSDATVDISRVSAGPVVAYNTFERAQLAISDAPAAHVEGNKILA